ncbi:hypothetical protein PENSPDRAFT_651960 [Peniophora sp. CONT]|nr:hypothetical protein PENSPDRAFT_651960 [Peniophora sp. CONT]
MSEDRLANIAGVGLFLVPVSCVGLFALISRKRTQPASNVKLDAEANVVSARAPSPNVNLLHDREPGIETKTLLRGRQTRASTL